MIALLLSVALMADPAPRAEPLSLSPNRQSGPLLVLELVAPLRGSRTTGFLMLADVACPVDDRGGVWPLVQHTILADTLTEAPPAWIAWSRVRHRLRGVGLDPARIELRGPALVALDPGAAR